MKCIISSIVVIVFLYSCSNNRAPASAERPLPDKMSYTYECLDELAAGNPVITTLQHAERLLRVHSTDKIEVSDDDQNAAGDEFLKGIRKTGQFKIDYTSAVNEKLNFILNDLLRKRVTPSRIKYSIYLVDDLEKINAFTFGGKIFITKAILKKTDNDNQLYTIIGHEIGHNEKGHIKSKIQEIKATKALLGDAADVAVEVMNVVTAVFNQKLELEADYYGIGLVYMLGQSPCPIVDFWNKMAKDENINEVSDFFRSHPFSESRSKCILNHIKTNFNEICK